MWERLNLFFFFFLKKIAIFTQQLVKFDMINRLLKLVFDFCLPSQNSIKVWRVILKNNDIVDRQDTHPWLRRVTIPYKLFSMMKW